MSSSATLCTAAGGTARGLAELEAGLKSAGYSDPALLAGQYLTYHLVRLRAMHPESQEDGISLLRWHHARALPQFYPMFTLWLAEALDAAGEHAEARRLYARFAVLWAGADPELLPLVERARSGVSHGHRCGSSAAVRCRASALLASTGAST